MNENIATDLISTGDLRRLEYDWYAGGIPGNVHLGENVYIDTAYGFAPFHSEQVPGLTFGDASGAYDRTTFIVGPRGRIEVGAYTILNAAYLVCNEHIELGEHCLLAWGSVVTDTWPGNAASLPISLRREVMRAIADDPARRVPAFAAPQSIVLEDNVWIGFDAVILPGVRLGRGCVVGCKTIVAEDVPPYAVVAGSPSRIVRYLEPDDTEEERTRALRDYAR
ncbi:MAG TPA: acyltransferase [Pyrinomonadaceae bacterium]|nr:acyltransferase [Pyrinomonadaceae bacterium]